MEASHNPDTHSTWLYFSKDLRSVLFPVWVTTEVLWSLLAEDAAVTTHTQLTALWRLTPAAHAMIWHQAEQLEQQWYRCAYPADKYELLWERWQKIDGWAQDYWGEQDLLNARAEWFAGNRPRLPAPPSVRDALPASFDPSALSHDEWIALIAQHNALAMMRQEHAEARKQAALTRPRKKTRSKKPPQDADIYWGKM